MLSTNLCRNVFAKLLSEKFKIYFDARHPSDAQLIEVAGSGNLSTREVFTVVFQARTNSPFQKNIYELEHPVLGSFELFLVPIGSDETGIRFEAVIKLENALGAIGDSREATERESPR